MNKIVVIGIVTIIIVAILAGILVLNHPNSSNDNGTNTIVTFPPTTVTTNTTTPSTTTVTPTTSTNINSTTSTSTNTSLNLQMNTFYFIGENSTGYYYIFVLNLTSYKEFLQLFSVPENSKIIGIGVQNKGIKPTQIVENGDYLFVLGYTIFNISLIIGNNYPTIFILSNGVTYQTQLIYEGNWTGSLP
jgi:hypothetical protein